MAKQIELGQTWKSKYGQKGLRHIMTVVKRLNAKGRLVAGGSIILLAFLATCSLIMTGGWLE